MANIDVKEQFIGLFAQPLEGIAKRRVVIWHDPAGEFEQDFESLMGDGGFVESTIASNGEKAGALDARPIAFLKDEEGKLFNLKRAILRELSDSDIALYRRRPSGDIQGDMLADVELYADQFQADALSLLQQSTAATNTLEVRQALDELRTFFASKERLSQYVAIMPGAQSASDVRAGVLAVVLGKVEPTSQGIVRAFATSLLEDDAAGEEPETLKALDRYELTGVLAAYLERATGYKGDLPDIHSFMRHLLLSAFSATVPPEVMAEIGGSYSRGCAQFCLGIVHDWAQAEDCERDVLLEESERVGHDLNLSKRLSGMPLESLMRSDVFPVAGQMIVKELAVSLASGADRRSDAREAARIRRTLSDYANLAPCFDALEAACDILDFLRDHVDGYHLLPAKAVWEAYKQDWWRMDSAYRHFCRACRHAMLSAEQDVSEALSALADWADSHYINGFLVPANECWVSSAEADWEQIGYVEGVPRQRRFYDEVVESELAGAKRAVVIISDALRYEVACELMEDLARKQRVSCDIGAVQGTFPSITSLGMASLLPHKRLSIDVGNKLDVFADDLPTSTTAQRESVLRARREASVALKATDVLGMKAAEVRDITRDSQVVYIFHNAIDARGDNTPTEHEVFDACESAIQDIGALVRSAINQMKTSRIVVTADHGFLYTRDVAPVSDKFDQAPLKDAAVHVGERFAIAKEGDLSDNLLIRLSLDAIGGGDLAGLAPRGFVRINRPGGVSHYAHGGITLEELCVPVLRVHHGRVGSRGIADASPAELKVLDTNRRITSPSFGVRLYQPEAVVGNVAPAEYELVLVDETGNPVSDTRWASAASTSDNEQERVTEVRFMLRDGVKYESGKPYYLVTRYKDSGEVAWREEFHIEIAFAPMEDFGF